jgi:transposase
MILTLSQALDLLSQKDAHIDELTRKLESTQRQLTILQHQMDQMLRRLYGRKSEQLNPNQLMFDSIVLQSLTQNTQKEAVPAPPVKPATVKPRKASGHHGRIPIPEHLERVEILLDIPEEQKFCPKTGEPLKVITIEVSEKLEYRPGKLIVNVYKRPQYALPEKSDTFGGILAVPMPDHPIAKCKADVGLIAHLIVSKFADHLPLYRQNGIFEREGVTIPRATQSSWLMQTYESIKVLEEVFRQAVLEEGVLFTDDTPTPLQEQGIGKFRKARIWVYLRGGTGPPLVAYDFSIDRSKRSPLDYLKDYRGYVHADAYSGYDELFRKEGIVEVGCWAHARRKFDEATSSRPKEATDILARLYHEVETPCAGKTPEERCLFRQIYATPLLDGIFEKLEELRPDNNLAENAMRPVALGRKNWLFVGSERGGRAAALFMGLIHSCKNIEINPWDYFDDMLRRIMSQPLNRLRELLPDLWKPLTRN